MTGQDELQIGDLELLLGLINRTVSDVVRWLPGPAWTPAWQSMAAAELANTEVGSAGVPWGERPLRTAYAMTAIALHASLDSLDAIGQVLSLTRTPLVPGVLARASLEAAALVWWLSEPEIGARQRVIRNLLARLSSARNLEHAIAATDPSLVMDQYGETHAKVQSVATALGLVLTKTASRTECEGVRLPGYTQRVKDLSARHVAGAYPVYSGMAHAELFALMQGWRNAEVEVGEEPRLVQRPSRTSAWSAVASACICCADAATRVAELFGLRTVLVDSEYWYRSLAQTAEALELASPP